MSPFGRRPAAPANPDSVEAAVGAGLRILTGAAQSEIQLQQRLLRRGFSREAATAAVAKLRDTGYVNDVALAASIVDSRQRQGYGRARVVADLRARRIGDEVAGEATGATDEDADLSAARIAVEKWQRSHTGPFDAVAQRKLGALLQRRGFSGRIVRHLIDEVSHEAQ